MSNPRATRSNYFIKAGLQIKFTFVIVMIVLLVATITFFNLYIIGDYVVQNSSSLIELRDMKSFIYTVFSIVGWRIVTLGVRMFFHSCNHWYILFSPVCGPFLQTRKMPARNQCWKFIFQDSIEKWGRFA